MADPKLCLNWNNFQDNLRSAFQGLRWDADFADVTLACEDQSIKAHQVVLSACSPFFKNLLKTHSHPNPLIYMRGVKLDNLLALMDYIYLGSVEISQDHIEEFLILAEELQLKGLIFGEIVSGSFSSDIPLEQDESIRNEEDSKEETSTQSVQLSVIKYSKHLTAGNQEQSFKLNALASDDIKKKIVKKEKQATRNGRSKTANDGKDLLKHKPDKNMSNDILEQIDLMIEKQEKNFYCKVCGYNSRNKGHANEHVEKHIEGLEYPCSICSKILRYLIFHVKEPQTNSTPKHLNFFFSETALLSGSTRKYTNN